MKKLVAMLLALTLAFGLLPVSALAAYTDVPLDASYTEAIDRLVDLGVMIGVSENEFAPGQAVTRAQAVTALGRLADVDQKEATGFTDVTPNSWYSGYVGWAEENGFVLGDGKGHFMPNALITSADLNRMITRYADSQGIKVSLYDTGANSVTRADLAQRLVAVLDAVDQVEMKRVAANPADPGYYAKVVDAELYNYRLIRSIPTAFDPDAYNTYYTLAKNAHVDTLNAANLTDRDKANLDAVIKARKALVQVKDVEDVVWYIWGDEIATTEKGKTVQDSDFFTTQGDQVWDNPHFVPFMVPYLLEDQSQVKGNLIAIAGGGFSQRNNDVEGYPIAEAFNKLGYNAFVLQRRVAPYSSTEAYLDLQRGIRYLRSRIESDGLGGGDCIVAAGFSGGGMTIMGQINELYGDIQPTKFDTAYTPDAIDQINSDLDVALVIYGPGTLDTENPNIPAIFLAGGMDDTLTFSGNLSLMEQLVEMGIKTELQTFAYTGHGYGVGTGGTNSVEWIGMADTFIDQAMADKNGNQIPEPYTKQQQYHLVLANGGPMDFTLAVNDDETKYYLIWTAFGDLQIVYGTMSDWVVTSVDFDRVGFFGQDAQEILNAAVKTPDAWTPTGNTGVSDDDTNTPGTSTDPSTPSETYSDIVKLLKEIDVQPGSANYYAKLLEAEFYNYRLIRSVPTAFDANTYNTYYTQAKNTHVDTLALNPDSLTDLDKTNLDKVVEYRKALVQVKPATDVMWYIWGDKIATSEKGKGVQDSDFNGLSSMNEVIWDNSDFVPFMVPYLLDNQAAVKGNLIAIAGGGFAQRNNDVEGYPIAEAFNELGWNVFVLQRRVEPYAREDAYMDLQRAIRYIRNLADNGELGGADMIAATGFSGGGGTITGTVNNLYGDIQPTIYDAEYTPDAIDQINADLDVAFVIYGPSLLNEENPNIPAIFLAGGMDDTMTYSGNISLLKQLVEMGIRTEIHTFANTGHGYGVGTGGTNSVMWIKMADCFVDQVMQEKGGVVVPAEYTKHQEYHLVLENGGPMDFDVYINDDATAFYMVWTAFGDLQIVYGKMSNWTVTSVDFDRVGFFGQDAQEILDAANKSASAWIAR